MRKILGKRHGFTILEMLTVVIILGIMAALAIPNFDMAIKKIRFKSASNEIMAGLRKARSNAIAQRMQYGVNLDVDNKVLTVFQDNVDPANFTLDDGDSVVILDTLGSSIESVSTSFGTDQVFFFPDGRASATGNITGDAYWGGEPATVHISVLAATGRVRIDSLSY